MKAPYLVLLATLLYALTAGADPRLWDPQGVSVRTGTYLQVNPATALDADGNALYVWAEQTGFAFDIRAQRVDNQGVEGWTPGGITVCGAPGQQQSPMVCRVIGGWIVAWVDSRTNLYADIYAQFLNDAGVPQWSANDFSGVCVNQGTTQLYYQPPMIAVDGLGGAFILWIDAENDIRAQRIEADGAVAWPASMVICSADAQRSGLVAVADGAQNVLLAWIDRRNANNDIYAARISVTGTMPWGQDGLPIAETPDDENSPALCSDAWGGVYIAWEVQPFNSSSNLYIQRVNGLGTALFAPGGNVLCGALHHQRHPALATSVTDGGVDGCLAVWEDCRANGFVDEVWAQKVSPTGDMLGAVDGFRLSGNANADSTNPTGAWRQAPRLISDRSGGLICAWSDSRDTDGATGDLYAVRVLSTGTLAWGGLNGTLLANGSGDQNQPLLRVTPDGGVGLLFADYRNGSGSLRLQALDLASGSRLLDPEGVILVRGIDGYAQRPHVNAMNEGRSVIVWEDNREGSSRLLYQILDDIARPERTVNGVPLVPDNEGSNRLLQENAALAADGSGGLFVAFEDLRTGHRRIRLQRLDGAGEIACTAAARLVYSDELTTDQKDVFIAPDGQGGCYLAWSNLDHNYNADSYVMRFDADCQPVAGWDQPVRLSQTPTTDEPPQGIAAVEGGCLAFWRTGTWGNYLLLAAKVSSAAVAGASRTISEGQGWQYGLALAPDGVGGAYAAWEMRSSVAAGIDIVAQRLNALGEEQWAHNGVTVISDTLLQDRPKIATDTQRNLLVVWEDFRNGTDLDLYAQKLSPQGQPLWDATGIVLAVAPASQTKPAVAADGADGWFVAWSDWRNITVDNYHPDLYGQHLSADGQIAGDDPFWVAGGTPLVAGAGSSWDPVLVSSGGEAVVVWSQDNSQDPEMSFRDLAAQRIHLAPLGVADRPAARPGAFALHAAYPNPFNPTTTIAFDLPQAARVKLVVFDLLGREVAVLEDARLVAGRYQRHFDASALASGMYFYRLEAPAFTTTRKLLLLK